MAQQVKASIEIEGGKKITHYHSLVIEQDLFQHHLFEIVVPLDVLEKKDAIFFNSAHKDICGKPITISFEPVLKSGSFNFQFKGVITSIKLSNENDFVNVFLIKGYSPSIILEDGLQRRTFVEKNLQDIFGTVLSGYPGNVIKKKIKPKYSSKIKYLVQYDETNFGFMNRMAEEFGEWFFYNGKEIILGTPDDTKETEFVVNGIQTFEMSVSLVPGKFKILGYDYLKNRNYEGASGSQAVDGLSDFSKFALDESESLFNQDNLLLAKLPVYSQSELDDLIKIRRSVLSSKLVIFHGKGENPDISVGSVINVTGTRLDKGDKIRKENFGKYRVIEIIHTVDKTANYSNSFKAIPETAKFPPNNPYVKRPVSQSDLAVVTDNNDPDKLGRVKVEFIWPGNDKKSDWIRVGTFYAGGGDGKGMHFIPEKEAQVIIGYELSRPDRPFVITSLYPKKDGTRAIKGNNEEKFIYTKAGNQIELIDKQGENKIAITNTNKSDTSITLEFKGNGQITIKTKGNINIEAEENITIKATKKFSLEAQDIELKATNTLKGEGTQKVSMSGTEVNLDAKAKVEIKGGATAKVGAPNAEVGGDALLTLKGGLVKIN